MSRLLIAGIGNIFFGDDAFGVETARRLAARPQSDGVRVVDFGIRGFDLACALTDGCGGAVLIDALRRGGVPGALYVLDLEGAGSEPPAGDLDAHGLHPAQALRLARALGALPPWLRLVGCEPLTFGSEDEPALGLSAPVQAAVEEAVRLVETLTRNYLDGPPPFGDSEGASRPPEGR
jgi:hydrogenase maturation protease